MSRLPYRIACAGSMAVLALTAACAENITGDAEQVGQPGLNFAMDVSNARGAPAGAGALTSYIVTSVVSPLPSADAFKRGGTTNAITGYGTGCVSGLSGTNQYCFGPWLRDSVSDPRLPALVRPAAASGRLTPVFFDIGGPEFFGTLATPLPTVKAFELYLRIQGLKPSTQYTVALMRYGLQVRGENDAVEMLVYGRVTEPDSLVLIEPNAQTVPGVNYNWVSNAGCNNNTPPARANPWSLGTANSNSSGQVTFDKCWASDTLFYRNSAVVVPDSSPIVRNSLGPRTRVQQFNYAEVYEGNGVSGRPVARIQMGADLNPVTGEILPNGFAPFPTAALAPPVLIADLKVAEGRPTGMRTSVLPLETLEGETYALYLANRETGASSPVVARYHTIRRDTTGRDDLGNVLFTEDTSDVTLVGEIMGGPGNVRHFFEVHDSLQTGGLRLGDYTDFALVTPSSPNTGSVWYHYLDRNYSPDVTTDDRFYMSDSADAGRLPFAAQAEVYVFRLSGNGFGTNRGDQIGIRFQHLPRPPAGFYYNVWLVPDDAADPQVSLGPITTPLPEEASLMDADLAAPAGVITATEITDAVISVRPALLAALGVQLAEYGTIRLTLEAKDGIAPMSSWVVLEGAFATHESASP